MFVGKSANARKIFEKKDTVCLPSLLLKLFRLLSIKLKFTGDSGHTVQKPALEH